MEPTVITLSAPADALEIKEDEVLRYLGYKKAQITDDDRDIAAAVIEDARRVIRPMACYARFPLEFFDEGGTPDPDGDLIALPWGKVLSRDLAKNLRGCSDVFVFACTLGVGFDMLLRKIALRSMSRAALLQGAGAAAAEALADMLNDELRYVAEESGEKLRPRYSPGFGDFTLENQTGVFSVLDPPRRIGLTLRDTLIMTPEKSITALVGIYRESEE